MARERDDILLIVLFQGARKDIFDAGKTPLPQVPAKLNGERRSRRRHSNWAARLETGPSRCAGINEEQIGAPVGPVCSICALGHQPLTLCEGVCEHFRGPAVYLAGARKQ